VDEHTLRSDQRLPGALAGILEIDEEGPHVPGHHPVVSDLASRDGVSRDRALALSDPLAQAFERFVADSGPYRFVCCQGFELLTRRVAVPEGSHGPEPPLRRGRAPEGWPERRPSRRVLFGTHSIRSRPFRKGKRSRRTWRRGRSGVRTSRGSRSLPLPRWYLARRWTRGRRGVRFDDPGAES
jgi:hypothetical protein